MPMLRQFRNQGRLSVLTVIFLVFFLIFFIWFIETREHYKHSQIANERCASELSSVRYQLDVVSEYKKKMGWLLTEAQKDHQMEKNLVKDMMENYGALKHHLYICEGQTEVLEKECQVVKEELIKTKQQLKELQGVKEELEKCKKPAG